MIVLILICDFDAMQKTVNLIIRNKGTTLLRTIDLDTIYYITYIILLFIIVHGSLITNLPFSIIV